MNTTGISELEVENNTYLVEKIASECAPLQYVRELTVNAIQAIQARIAHGATGLEGAILWDVDWLVLESKGVYKLQISDNGTGMTGPQMDQFIRKLSSSGRVQSMTENFGLGAKITAGVLNPHGLYYKSWVDGEGSLAVFHKDMSVGKYGLRHLPLSDGSYGRYAPLADDAKCEPIDSCGTAVTLFGRAADDMTMKPDDQPSKWLIFYLNTRFFEIPDKITLKVRDFNNADFENWPRSAQEADSISMGQTRGSQLRAIKGMKRHLDEAKGVVGGTVELQTARIHWFILPEELIKQADIWDCRAHSGALYQGELYEIRRARQSFGRIRDFGVIFGYDRMIIYAEPKQSEINVSPNTARSFLVVDGEPLPWDQWAAEFRQKMPQEIKDMMDGIVSASGGRDHKESIKRRLKDIRALLKIRRYRRDPKGHLQVEGTSPGGQPRRGGTSRTGTSSGGGGTGGGRGADPYGAFIKSGGDNAVEIASRNNDPDVRWVSISNGLRVSDDELEDRAAMFIETENQILANEDFRVFLDFIDEVGTRYPGAPANDVKDLVQEWFEQQLIEAVLGVQTLKGSSGWNPDELELALSPEALTTAVMPRYNTMRQITRSLGARFGATAAEDGST
jgi:uncharacterized membrane protein YgcG